MMALTSKSQLAVSGVVLEHVPGTRQAVITYNLSADAIITMAIETNGVRLAENEVTALDGDVCGLVTAGNNRKIDWTMGVDWPEQNVASAKAILQVWPTNAPPPYAVIDLSGGAGASTYPVYYYASLEALPNGGLENDLYRTVRLVLKKVRTGAAWPENGRFLMGSPVSETGRITISGVGETEHEVLMTSDYYLGVFEVTQSQWYQVTGRYSQYFANANSWESRPVERVSYWMIRSSTNNTGNAGVDWPTTGAAVGPESFLSLLRSRTGLSFDLPTEAQWEYACRAGTRGALNDGTINLVSSSSYQYVDALARCTTNRTGTISSAVDVENGTAKVGSYLPNAWGFYDMLGNVQELCLDWFQVDLGTVSSIDPAGPDTSAFDPDQTGSYEYGRLLKGGALDTSAWALRSAYRRAFLENDNGNYTVGFRLAVNFD